MAKTANDLVVSYKGKSVYDSSQEMEFPFLVTSVNPTDGTKSGFFIDDSGAIRSGVVVPEKAADNGSQQGTTAPASVPATGNTVPAATGGTGATVTTPVATGTVRRVAVPTLSDEDRAELARLRAARDEQEKQDAADAAELAQLRAAETEAPPADTRTDEQREQDAADAAELESLRRPSPGPGATPGESGVAGTTPNPEGN